MTAAAEPGRREGGGALLDCRARDLPLKTLKYIYFQFIYSVDKI
jgi:hypothetical protein